MSTRIKMSDKLTKAASTTLYLEFHSAPAPKNRHLTAQVGDDLVSMLEPDDTMVPNIILHDLSTNIVYPVTINFKDPLTIASPDVAPVLTALIEEATKTVAPTPTPKPTPTTKPVSAGAVGPACPISQLTELP